MIKLGIFWGIIEYNLIEKSLKTRTISLLTAMDDEENIQNIGGFKTTEKGHVDEWQRVRTTLNPMATIMDLKEIEYDEIPRGRVNWIEENNSYLILLDKRLMNDDFIQEIIKTFGLESKNTKIMGDTHYSTPNYERLYLSHLAMD